MGILRITAFIAGPCNFARALQAAYARLTLAMETGPQDFGKKELYCVLCDMKCRGDQLQAKTSACILTEIQ